MNNNRLCLDLAEYLIQFYEEAGRDAQELSTNMQIIKERLSVNKINKIDRSYTAALSNDVVTKCQKYHSDKNIETRTSYFYAATAHSCWCAIQHCACGALKPAVEAAQKTIEYCASARCNKETYEAMKEGDIAGKAFLRPYKKLGIVE